MSLDELASTEGERLHINIEATSACMGAAPSIARSREQLRPVGADAIGLAEIDYDGTAAQQTITLVFDQVMHFEVIHDPASDIMTVTVQPRESRRTERNAARSAGVRVIPPDTAHDPLVVNLASSRKPHVVPDAQAIGLSNGLRLFQTEIELAGVKWYRLRVGFFSDTASAESAVARLMEHYPTAWIDRARTGERNAASGVQPPVRPAPPAVMVNAKLAALGLDQVDALMAEAARELAVNAFPRAVQLYTKVLQAPNHDRHAEAQEYLAVAREKSGQTAHAKAEYERYLANYPDGEAASRVRQRLAALVATDRLAKAQTETGSARPKHKPASDRSWRIQSYASQYYRRDVNQPNEDNDIVSQSALYSDLSIDARRRGERFDFATRITGGYRNDFLDENEGSGNQLRVAYAYADLADSVTGLRARVGRQSRNRAGVLGRFDGFNLGYRATERIFLNGVVGKPVNSAADGIDSSRLFYGSSVTVDEVLENLELSVFFIQQQIDGIDDRQAIGTDFRYLGENQSLWGLIDFDTLYNELGSAYIQGSWRFASRLTLHGSVDRRHSPFLSTGNALIGQPVASISDLLEIFPEEEVRKLSLDRSPLSTTYTVGISHSLSPRFQVNADANQTMIEASPESGGVATIPQSTYRYVGTTLVAGSLVKEGDVSVLGFRYADSDTSEVVSLTLDTRYPVGRKWRINPRLRVDRRKNTNREGYQLFYTPGLRLQYRFGQKFRIDVEAGKRITRSENEVVDADRESYFFNIGYQAYF